MIINKKKEYDSEIIIDDKLISLIEKCQQKTENLPTFEDFRIEVVEKFSRTLCQYDGQIFY